MIKELDFSDKYRLEDYGIEVFLAHEDIKPSAEWVDTICTELKTCDIFIPILTEYFDESDWTDQETGIAFVLDKVVIPLKVTVDPHGFISRFQALKMDVNGIKSSCNKLVNVIALNSKLGDTFRDNLIKKFGDCACWAGAGYMAELLSSIEGYTLGQLNDIIKYTIENSQINDSFDAQKKLRSFIYKYQNRIDPELLQAFYKAIKI